MFSWLSWLLCVVIVTIESFGVHNRNNISSASMSQITLLIDIHSKFVINQKTQLVIFQEKSPVQLNY